MKTIRPTGTCQSLASCIRGQRSGSSSPSKVGARCVSSARRDLCGGRPAMAVPTATGERQREEDDVGLDGILDRPRNYRAAEFLDERRQRVSAPSIGDRDIDAGAGELARQGGADIS